MQILQRNHKPSQSQATAWYRGKTTDYANKQTCVQSPAFLIMSSGILNNSFTSQHFNFQMKKTTGKFTECLPCVSTLLFI